MIEIKAEAEGDCPNCKNHIKLPTLLEFEMPKDNVPKALNVQVNQKPPQIQTNVESHTHSTPEKNPHDSIAENMPSGVNFTRCKDGSCGHTIIKNKKGLTTEFKTCPNCGDNTNAKKSKICKTCGKTPETVEDWQESDVKIEVEQEEDEDDE